MHPACLAFAILLPFLEAGAQPLAPVATKLRTLTTALEAHSLPVSEARLHYPIHIRATVTYYDDDIFFVHDSTAGIFVRLPKKHIWPSGPPSVGTIVDIHGRSGTGDFAPVLENPSILFVGHSNVSFKAKPMTFTRLLTGTEDAQLVEIEGVVQSVFQTPTHVIVEVATADGSMSATTAKAPGVDYDGLIDATVRIRGNAGPLFNADGQMTGFHVFFPDMTAVTIADVAPSNPFSIPPRPIKSLSVFTPTATLPHRIHVRGRVTLQWPGKMLCIQDETQGLCALSSQNTHLTLGESADILGFAIPGGYKPSLINAVFKPLGGNDPVLPSVITAKEAFRGNHDSSLVQIEGQLIGHELDTKEGTLMLSSGKFIFPVILPEGSIESHIPAINNGSKLRITGICSVKIDTQMTSRGRGQTVITSFRILLRSPQDVVILAIPSWWTAARIFFLLALTIAITAAVLGWVVVLRKRVDQQTKTIRESEKRFRHIAQHDALTGLPTRMLLHDRIQIALARARRYKTGIALLMLDVDNFKQINDSLGHHAGDQALCVTSQRLVAMVRKIDTVARMGGDEFVVLLTDLYKAESAEMVAAKIITALSVPIPIGEEEIPISVSVGVCAISDGEVSADVLLKSVDTAMYHAKADGRNCFRVFTTEMESATIRKRQLQSGLGRALELHEFELEYQPQISFSTGELTGVEALLRWNSKQLGSIGPAEFIPVAEEAGLIVIIGEWVMREACRQIGLLERSVNRSLSLAVNLSPRQFLHKDLCQMIHEALVQSGRSPHLLTVEITENILMGDSFHIHHVLSEIRKLGVQLALDDFGIGFSNLSYITRFPVDWIKIDKSLICHSTTQRNHLAVVRAIVAMAHGLDIHVMAEGVETMEQFALLKTEQCDIAQGFYLGRPMDLPKLQALVTTLERDRVKTNAGFTA
ncbi:EAL domain-containing protein [Granulicella sp. dw_53]|uniref:putative bifunctional diguanylate cyclase/phosphodiesterase n=1 Tax=Granulicella sp. dw_53 TaxID=2719792 RepID=UPI001BD2710F|nr:EAL domain-containing protein [Granulicella sp. dw_53]